MPYELPGEIVLEDYANLSWSYTIEKVVITDDEIKDSLLIMAAAYIIRMIYQVYRAYTTGAVDCYI